VCGVMVEDRGCDYSVIMMCVGAWFEVPKCAIVVKLCHLTDS